MAKCCNLVRCNAKSCGHIANSCNLMHLVRKSWRMMHVALCPPIWLLSWLCLLPKTLCLGVPQRPPRLCCRVRPLLKSMRLDHVAPIHALPSRSVKMNIALTTLPSKCSAPRLKNISDALAIIIYCGRPSLMQRD